MARSPSHLWGSLLRTAAELVLGGEPDAVPRARHFTAASLVGEPADTVDDAELIVTELITNAALHGEPPIVLRLSHHDGVIRIEVEDTGHSVPVRGRQSNDAMTGRGLSLVEALAGTWGVDRGARGGKVVWAELAEAGPTDREPRRLGEPLDVDALLASWQEDALVEPTYRVTLGSVPTDLLLAAKAHIDNVVREMLLMRGGEASTGDSLPPAMAALVETVTRDFAEARTEIKRQALAAAERGDVMTDLSLSLPLSAAAAGERYLAALDQADRYARAARLLTMAPPRSHREFRRWYVQSLVDQLRALDRGDQAQRPIPFPQLLAGEVDRLSTLEDTWERLELLQNVTTELTGAQSVPEIARTVVNSAAGFVGVETARVYVLEGRMLRTIAWHGRTSDQDVYDEFSLDSDLPGAAVARTGEPAFMRSLAQIYQQFPDLDGYYSTERSLHVMPLSVGDHTLGLLALTFVGGEIEESAQVSFVRALADALAQAIERAHAMEQANAANERLTMLANASVVLSASLDYEATLDAVTHLMVPQFADWCAVELLRDDQLQNAALLHSDPEKIAWASDMTEKYPTDMSADRGAARVVRTGKSELYAAVPPELLEQGARDAEHLDTIRQFGISSGLVVPLTGRGGILGAITLVYAESGRRYSEQDVPFLEDVARRAALALEAADTLREQSGRLEDVSRVAEAAQLAILAPPPAQLGPVLLAARYASAAAEALVGGDLYEVVPRSHAVRLLIGDVRGKGLTAVRTATIVLGEFRAAAADLDDLGSVAAQLDRRVRPYLGDEDFVTALVAEIAHDGSFAVACCGHPAPLLAADGRITELEIEPSIPLGLGAAPGVVTGRLEVGDRLLMYTDGIIEARTSTGEFVDFMQVVSTITSGSLDDALDRVLDALHQATGPELGDDLALLVAEYRPEPG